MNELTELCDLPQPQVSQFLTRMRLEGIIEADAVGRQRLYRLVDTHVQEVIELLARLYCPTPTHLTKEPTS